MTSELPTRAEEILQEWFGVMVPDGLVADAKQARWFKKDPRFDAYLRDHYEGEIRRGLAGELDDWSTTARGTLALIIVLDQFTRNIYRDTPAMYCGDKRAVELTEQALDRGCDRQLCAPERHFLYMPLMHAEDLARQDRAMEVFGDLANEVGPGTLRYAQQHRDIVARFGRFPHRNEILGRASTAEEIEFLKQPGSSF